MTEPGKAVLPRAAASSATGRGVRHLVWFAGFVCLSIAPGLVQPAAAGSRQDGATDSALDRASGGRTLRVGTGANGRTRVVQMPLETYVARVVAGEGEPKAPPTALEALAVAVRTFAEANSGRHRRDGFDLCDTTHCQVLRASTPAARRAALATAGRVLVYQGEPADVFYSASCGGRSEAIAHVWPGAGDRPYLRSHVDDVHRGEPPWTFDLPLAAVDAALRRVGFDGRLRDVRIDQRSPSNRVIRLRVSGLRPDTITGADFRAAIGVSQLRSTAFTVAKVGRLLRFTGRGYGHGVGLCVVGAGRRAARGESMAEILGHYYPGLRLERMGAGETSANGRPEGREAALEVPTGPAPPAMLGDVGVAARVPPAGSVDATELAGLAARARDDLAARLGIAKPPPLSLELHASLDGFRHATGRPWWVGSAVVKGAIDLAPAAVLAQRDGFELSVRRAVAEALTAEALADRPAWVHVGAARYYARDPASPPPTSARTDSKCPTDAELTLAVSAPAYGDAVARAEACFARAVGEARGDWRRVR